MERRTSQPRENWRATVEGQGLVYPVTTDEQGNESPYWWEQAHYVLTGAEVDYLEALTEELHGMCVEAGRFLATGAMGNLGLPPGSLQRAQESLDAGEMSLYGRFDLAYDLSSGVAKLLEYNADTPTGLIESSVAQWFWAQDVFPDHDQWNSIHERLLLRWQQLRGCFGETIHFAFYPEATGEEYMTVAYLQDTCTQAGFSTRSLDIRELGYNHDLGVFVGLENEPIRTCFKLYPLEDMLAEEFGQYLTPVPGDHDTRFVEPLWKVLLSNKALLAALNHLYPDHPAILPAYLDSPGPLHSWVQKPLYGREGAGISVYAPGVELSQASGGYGDEGYCYQQWCPLPEFDGNKMVLGTWMIGDNAAGVGIRESNSWVTDYYARFVPHIIDAPAPAENTRQEWLTQDFSGR